MTSFWTSFLPRWRKRSSDDLPLSSRLSTLESEMLDMRAQADAMYSIVRKLQGKVYRGVPLGDTVDVDPADTEKDSEPDQPFDGQPQSKADLYKRAAELRGRYRR